VGKLLQSYLDTVKVWGSSPHVPTISSMGLERIPDSLARNEPVIPRTQWKTVPSGCPRSGATVTLPFPTQWARTCLFFVGNFLRMVNDEEPILPTTSMLAMKLLSPSKYA
jgi:hypothetical protein